MRELLADNFAKKWGFMSKMSIQKLVLGGIRTNCYIVINQESKEAFIIDPAAQAKKIIEFVSGNNLKPVAILLTHGHFDHIMAANELKDKYSIPIMAGELEKEFLLDVDANLSAEYDTPYEVKPDRFLQDEEEIILAGYNVKVLETPGHTEGSVCYYMESEKVLFSGDTVFYGSVGRTDLPAGSSEKIKRSVREKISGLPISVSIYPGHGLETSVGWELKNNPWF